MDLGRIGRYLFWYTGVAALVTGSVLYAVATAVGVAVGLVAVVLLVGGLFYAAIVASMSTRGIQSASDGSVVGFLAPNSMRTQPSSLSLPNRVALLCYFGGLSALGLATLGYLLA